MRNSQSNNELNDKHPVQGLGAMRKRAIRYSGLRNPSNPELARCLLGKYKISERLKTKTMTKRRARKIISLFNQKLDNGVIAQ